jgi:O-antigen/teichoic acid export membrane protein
MIETWNDLLDLVWWALTGRENRPRFRLSLRPSRSAFAAVAWAWTSALLLLAGFIFTGDVNNPVPTWVFAVMGAIALLWAPTQYAIFVDAHRLRRLAMIAVVIGAPVWVLPVPPDVALSPVHRLALWALFGIATALAAPLLALPLRVLRPTSLSARRSVRD